MSEDDLDRAVRAYHDAQDAVPAAQERAREIVAEAREGVDRARQRLAAAIVRAAQRGVRQKVLAERTGYTRETIRRICRAAGVEPE